MYIKRVKIFIGVAGVVEQKINDWFDDYAKANGGPPVITNILQSDGVMLTVSIFYSQMAESK